MFRFTNRILYVLLIIQGFNLSDLWVKCQGHVSVLTIRQEAQKTDCWVTKETRRRLTQGKDCWRCLNVLNKINKKASKFFKSNTLT